MIKHGTVVKHTHTQGSPTLGDGSRSLILDIAVTVDTDAGERLTITDPTIVKDSLRTGVRVSVELDDDGRVIGVRRAA